MNRYYWMMVGLLVWLCISPVSGLAEKGLEFTVTVRSLGEGIEYSEESVHRWWQGHWSENTPDGALVLNIHENKIFLIDHATRTWYGGDIDASLAEMRREITQLTRKVRETYHLAEQAMMDETDNSFLPGIKLDYHQREKNRGRDCLKYRLLYGKELIHEIWLDDSIRPGNYLPLDQYLPVLRQFHAVTSVFAREFSGRDDYLLAQAIQARLLELFATGLEIYSVEYRRGSAVYEKVTRDIHEWDGEPAEFQPPPEYRRIEYRQYLENSLPTITDFLSPDAREKH
ncbi:MAG: hypothetical protein JXQ27_11745 [Acidobacteria bacterium]|nr:hypothetical protein [Acidobacteriota bacterium]